MLSSIMDHLPHMQKMKSAFKSDKLRGCSNPTQCVNVIEQQKVYCLLAEISHDSHIYYPLLRTTELEEKIRVAPQAVNKNIKLHRKA